MVKMIATKPHTYGGKTIEAGEEYEVDEQYAGTLVSLGRASRADEAAKGTKAKPTTTQSTEDNGDDKKTYRTRRVKAEDEE